MEILRVQGLGKRFHIHSPEREILSCASVSFTVAQGEFIGIVGRSGAGKSTILKCIHRSYLPTEGELWFTSDTLGRVNLCEATEREMLFLRRREIGYVSQFLSVMPRTTAREHVESALLDTGCGQASASERTEAMLRYFRLPPALWDMYPATFSGGEKLRLNLAHTMVKEPRLMLLDEPTASLDEQTKALVKDMLMSLKRRDTGMIGIFHDLTFMDGLCDRVYNLSEGVLL